MKPSRMRVGRRRRLWLMLRNCGTFESWLLLGLRVFGLEVLTRISRKPTANRSFCISRALGMSTEQCFGCHAAAVAIFLCRRHCLHHGSMTRYYVCQACTLDRLCRFCHEPGIITNETGNSDTDSADSTTSGDSFLTEDEAFSARASDSCDVALPEDVVTRPSTTTDEYDDKNRNISTPTNGSTIYIATARNSGEVSKLCDGNGDGIGRRLNSRGNCASEAQCTVGEDGNSYPADANTQM